MNILIIAATKMEIKDFCDKNPEANILITGVGIPFSSYTITKWLQNNKCDIIIQAGIAGSFSDKLPLGAVVTVRSEVFGSSGVSENKQFFTLFEKELAVQGDIFNDGYLINQNPVLENLPFTIVSGVTVDTVTDEAFANCVIYTKFSPDIETMEGAVLHYVCLNEKVQFLQLRSISNYVGERNKEKWKMKEALTNLNEALQIVYNSLK